MVSFINRAQRRRGYQYAIALTATLVVIALFTKSNVQYLYPEHTVIDPNDLANDEKQFSKLADDTSSTTSLSPIVLPPSPPPPKKERDTMACFKEQPWIQPALDHFFGPISEEISRSTQNSDESIKSMSEVRWGEYPPGQDLVTLKLNPTTNRYEMHAELVNKPNQPHKRQCILPILERAVQKHAEDLVPHLKGKDLKLTIETEDFAIMYRNSGLKLPAFALCTDFEHIDIPIPDFTFECYPEAKFTNSSWPAISKLLTHKASMLPWEHRLNSIFHRSNWDVGPRRGLMPFLKKIHEENRDIDLFGTVLDVADTGFLAVNKDTFVWLDGQCNHKFHIHTAGFSYSAALKYKLACGAVVFKFDSKYEEFYEPALVDGVHVIKLPAKEDGIDERDFLENSAPRIKEIVQSTLMDASKMSDIAKAGQDFVVKNLTSDALSCYWYGALLRYADLYYYTPPPALSPPAKEEKNPKIPHGHGKKKKGGGVGKKERGKEHGSDDDGDAIDNVHVEQKIDGFVDTANESDGVDE